MHTDDVNNKYLLASPCFVRGDVRGGDSTSLQPSAWPRATSISHLECGELEEGWEGSGDEAMYVSVVCFASTSPSPCPVNKRFIELSCLQTYLLSIIYITEKKILVFTVYKHKGSYHRQYCTIQLRIQWHKKAYKSKENRLFDKEFNRGYAIRATEHKKLWKTMDKKNTQKDILPQWCIYFWQNS